MASVLSFFSYLFTRKTLSTCSSTLTSVLHWFTFSFHFLLTILHFDLKSNIWKYLKHHTSDTTMWDLVSTTNKLRKTFLWYVHITKRYQNKKILVQTKVMSCWYPTDSKTIKLNNLNEYLRQTCPHEVLSYFKTFTVLFTNMCNLFHLPQWDFTECSINTVFHFFFWIF